MPELVKWEAAKRAIIEAHSVDEVAEIRDYAEARRYALKQAGEAPEIIRKAEEIKLRAERRAGQILQEMKERDEILSHERPRESQAVTLSDLGISKNESSKWQKIASIPEEKFETYLEVAKEITTSGAVNLGKEIKRDERIKSEDEKRKNALVNIDLRCGDFREVLNDVYDINAIITDPPYPKEYLSCFSDLAIYAKYHLAEDGFCVVYSGQYHLPKVIKMLSQDLEYIWTFCLSHTDKTQIVNGVNVMCCWKPVLIFAKNRRKMRFTMKDYFVSSEREKFSHEWQQSESGVKYLIESFTEPGDLVVDPFAGSGTFLKVAKEMKRNAIGAEIDKTEK